MKKSFSTFEGGLKMGGQLGYGLLVKAKASSDKYCAHDGSELDAAAMLRAADEGNANIGYSDVSRSSYLGSQCCRSMLEDRSLHEVT